MKGNKVLLYGALMIMIVGMIGFASAQPAGVGTLTQGQSTRGSPSNFTSVDAQGGNVTEINISAYQITEKWAGFYGQVEGSISLENGGGNVFYNWSQATPAGEVFASRDDSPTWGSIACADSSTITSESTQLGLGSGMDNITNTFCETCGNHTSFDVGAGSFTADECTYRTNVFDDNGAQTTTWDQILLTDGTDAIYSTVINADTTGFDGNTYDFQLMIGENSSSSQLTTYYFFVELA